MNRWPLLLFATLCLLPLACATARHECSAPSVRHYHHACITTVFRDASIREVMETISREAHRTIRVAAGIEDRVSVDFRGCPWRLAAEIAAMSAGCTVREDEVGLVVRRAGPVTIEFDHADLAQAIRALAAQGDLEADVAAEVKGDVSVAFVNWQWRAALGALVKDSGYSMTQEGFDRIVVGPDPQSGMEPRVIALGSLRPWEWSEAKIHTNGLGPPLRDPAKGITLVEALRYMLTRPVGAETSRKTVGRLDYFKDGNSIIVVDTPAVLDRIGHLIEELQVGLGQ